MEKAVVVILLLVASTCCALAPLNLILIVHDPPEQKAEESCGVGSCSSSNGDGGVLGAVQLAIDRVNKDAVVLEDYYLTFTNSSTMQCSQREAVDALYRNLFDDVFPDIAIIGAGCSASTEAVAQASRYFTLPMVSYASISGTLDNRQLFPYLSRTIPSGDLVAVGMATVVQYYGWTRAAVVTENRPEFTSMSNVLSQELGSEVDLIEIEFTSVLERKDFFPDGVRIFILNMQESAARWIICRAIESLNLEELRYVWLMQGWYEDRWWEGESDLSSEVNCTDGQVLNFLRQQRVLGVNHYPTPLNHAIVPPEVTPFSQVARFAYDAVWSVALGLHAALAELPNRCGNETGFEMFNPLDRDVASRSCLGELLSNSINGIAFDGASGSVMFENGSRSVDTLRVIQYRNGLGTGNATATIGTLFLTSEGGALFEYFDGESNETVWPEGIPADGTVHRKVERFPYVSLVVISYILNSVVIIAALLCALFTIVFHNKRLVKLTSPNLNYVIVAGVVIFALSTYMFVYPPISMATVTVFCSLRIWLVSIGTSLCFGMINAKMWRIFYIFHKPGIKKKVIKDWYLLLFVSILVVVDLVILIPVSIVKSGRFHPDVVQDIEHPGNFTDISGTISYVVTLCNSSGRIYILGVLFGYKAIVQAIGLTLAILIRNVEIKVLNDSKEISLTLYLSSTLLLATIIISVVFGERLNIYGATYGIGVPLSCSAVLIVVFFSKMVRLCLDPNGDKIFTQVKSTVFDEMGENEREGKMVKLKGKLEKKITEAEVKGGMEQTFVKVQE